MHNMIASFRMAAKIKYQASPRVILGAFLHQNRYFLARPTTVPCVTKLSKKMT
jgi:hypothetical protein